MKPGLRPPSPGHCEDEPRRDSGLESQMDLDWDDTLQLGQSWSLNQDLLGNGALERRWILWQEFMKEHDHLESWLRGAEQVLASSDVANVTVASAQEHLSKLEKLRCDAGPQRLGQLDCLTRKNRTLTRLFQGSMQSRLLALTRDCGLRWDDVDVRLESLTHRLKHFLSEWEEFEAERAELALWLADLNVRLTDVELLTGSTCEKLQHLQSFQQCVCVNSERVNALLQRGEALMQRSDASDAHLVEGRLLELLRSCSDVYDNIARTHTRLLSMRLVFEDDWILPRASDSGCPSESLLEDDAGLNLDLMTAPPAGDPRLERSDGVRSKCSLYSASPDSPRPASPAHEHLGLEWDPSVDVGRSFTPDGADSSYFSTCTGLGHRDGLKRRSYLSSLGSWSDINDIIGQETNMVGCQKVQDSGSRPPSYVSVRDVSSGPSSEVWSTSTPDGPLGYGGRRVRAWLGVQSSASSDEATSCCKAVQTEQVEFISDTSGDDQPQVRTTISQNRSEMSRRLNPGARSRDLRVCRDWTCQRFESELQTEEDSTCCDEVERQSSGELVSSRWTSSWRLLLLAAGLALILCLLWRLLETPCHRSNRMSHALHLTYINGPPPT